MDESSGKSYSLDAEYLCKVRERGKREQSRVVSLLKHVCSQENINEYILEILSELYFLNRKLKEEVERYDLTDCDKKTLFKVNEIDLFVLRTIILSKHKLVQQLSQMNISVREN
jgi:hypothetical protein